MPHVLSYVGSRCDWGKLHSVHSVCSNCGLPSVCSRGQTYFKSVFLKYRLLQKTWHSKLHLIVCFYPSEGDGLQTLNYEVRSVATNRTRSNVSSPVRPPKKHTDIPRGELKPPFKWGLPELTVWFTEIRAHFLEEKKKAPECTVLKSQSTSRRGDKVKWSEVKLPRGQITEKRRPWNFKPKKKNVRECNYCNDELNKVIKGGWRYKKRGGCTFDVGGGRQTTSRLRTGGSGGVESLVQSARGDLWIKNKGHKYSSCWWCIFNTYIM